MNKQAIPFGETMAPSETDGTKMIALCCAAFPDFEERYLTERLPRITDAVRHYARCEDWLVGFKLAYGRGPSTLYSWLARSTRTFVVGASPKASCSDSTIVPVRTTSGRSTRGAGPRATR